MDDGEPGEDTTVCEPLEEEAEVVQNYCVKVGFGDLNSKERL